MARLSNLLMLVLALACTSWLPAFAQRADAPAPAAEEVRAAQQVVRAQLAAFAADDADQAFSYATPAIRQMFGNAAQFMRMVQGAYPVVYRPASVLFLKPEAAGDELVQPVHMTDPAGNTWLAVYRLQRQDDRSWRIGACVLLPRAGKTA